MKILMIAPQPFFQPRGTPFSVLGRLKALSDLGHSVDLVTYHVGEDKGFPNIQIYRIPKLPIRKVKVGPSLAKIPMDIALFLKAFSLLRRHKYEVLHTHEEAGFMGILLKRIFKIPHIYDMHSSLPQQLHNFSFTHSNVIHKTFEWLEKKTLENAEGVITICPELYNYVESLGIKTYHTLIENVVDYASLFENTNGEIKTLVPWDQLKGRVKVLYSGTFEPYQGLDLLVESAAQVIRRHPEVVYLMVGGKPEQVEHYKNQVQKLGLSDHFYFTGMVSPVTAEKFVEYSDVLLSPRTHGNNTPLKIYSYLRSGKPIVATNLITHTQVMNDSVAILTHPSPEDFARGTNQVLENNELSRLITENARKLAEEKYTYSVYLKKLNDLYEHVSRN
ncbi:MAG: glycosyltransferase family 4 protein [Calditrichaeota bacterium]|nr:glycosyltransferase family 4 protein [Calditrichota bacterium]